MSENNGIERPSQDGAQRDVLNIDEAAELLGVSVKTFNKVLHTQNIPARKIGREWKFSRAALIAWVGAGRSQDFYTPEGGGDEDHVVQPQPAARAEKARRTAGWKIEY